MNLPNSSCSRRAGDRMRVAGAALRLTHGVDTSRSTAIFGAVAVALTGAGNSPGRSFHDVHARGGVFRRRNHLFCGRRCYDALIGARRFYARQGNEPHLWYPWHDVGVSASIAAKAATESGFRAVMENGFHLPPNEYMRFGTEMEPVLMDFGKRALGVIPNDWLILARDNALYGATPDGLSPDHTLIAECKTTTDPWDGAETNLRKIPVTYRRQIQWQLLVTGADCCALVWTLTERDDNGDLFTPWLDPRHVLIEPDEEMQRELLSAAERVLDARNDNF